MEYREMSRLNLSPEDVERIEGIEKYTTYAARKIIETRNAVMEAMWRMIIGEDIPEVEDGRLYAQRDIQTERGMGNRYIFSYKGKDRVALVETWNDDAKEYEYFMFSEEYTVEEYAQYLR